MVLGHLHDKYFDGTILKKRFLGGGKLSKRVLMSDGELASTRDKREARERDDGNERRVRASLPLPSFPSSPLSQIIPQISPSDRERLRTRQGKLSI